MKGIFVTGTDTGVGKTLISAAFLHRWRADGQCVRGFKPIASGCYQTEQGLRNDDALRLLEQSSPPLDYAAVNPFAFAPAIAPHLAASRAGVTIDLERIAAVIEDAARDADRVVVEGVGGWLVPLTPTQTVADLCRLLRLPAVVVVGIRLGCLNHALLTADHMTRHGFPVAGWIANQTDPLCAETPELTATLQQLLPFPLLASVPWMEPPDIGKLIDCVAQAATAIHG